MKVSNVLFSMVLISSIALGEAAPTVEPLGSSPHEQAMQFLKDCGKLLQPGSANTLNPDLPNPFMAALDQTMRKIVIGQDEAVESLSAAHEMVLSGMQDPERPLGSFLFIGPTGVGKTELTKGYVEGLGGNPDQDLIRIDLGTYAGHPEKSSEIIGTSAGFIGFESKPILHPSNLEARKIKVVTPNGRVLYVNVILLDELEKAPNEIFLLILSLLDHGRVQLGNGTWVNLRNSIVIATSNLGADAVNALLDEKRKELKSQLDAIFTDEDADTTGRKNPALKKQIKEAYDAALRDRFAPEFIPRWDRIIEFYHLGRSEFEQILTKLTAKMQKRIFNNADVKVNIVLSEAAQDQLIKTGTNEKDGARPLRNALERSVGRPLARLAATKQIKEGDVIEVDYTSTGWKWNILARDLTRPEMLIYADTEFPGYKMLEVKFEPAVNPADNQTPYDKMDIISALNSQRDDATSKSSKAPSVLKNLWRESESQSGLKPKMANIKIEEGNSSRIIQAPVQYIMIGDIYVRLEDRAGQIVASQRPGIELFPEDKVKRWTVEEVRGMFPKPEPEPRPADSQNAPNNKAPEPRPL